MCALNAPHVLDAPPASLLYFDQFMHFTAASPMLISDLRISGSNARAGNQA